MALPTHKTKIVCTLGPASESTKVLEEMIRAGMSIARLNFSHGDFASHEKAIKNLRAASRSTGKRLPSWRTCPGLRCASAGFPRSRSSWGLAILSP